MTPQDVLSFWLPTGPLTAATLAASFPRWFGGGPALDEEISTRFGSAVEDARAGKLDGWADTREGRVALVILLDQFSRNLHRDSPAAFSADPKARLLASEALSNGHYEASSLVERMFLVLPLGHSEDADDQRRSVALAEALALGAPAELRSSFFFAAEMARKHVATIARFGRFPLRNAALARKSTDDEVRFMEFERAKPSPNVGAAAARG